MFIHNNINNYNHNYNNLNINHPWSHPLPVSWTRVSIQHHHHSFQRSTPCLSKQLLVWRWCWTMMRTTMFITTTTTINIINIITTWSKHQKHRELPTLFMVLQHDNNNNTNNKSREYSIEDPTIQRRWVERRIGVLVASFRRVRSRAVSE